VLEVVYQDEHYYLDMDNLPPEIKSVAPVEVQDVVGEVCDECTTEEHALLAFQLNDLRKALDSALVKRFQQLVDQFTDTAFEPKRSRLGRRRGSSPSSARTRKSKKI
jgi:hypothetical protein